MEKDIPRELIVKAGRGDLQAFEEIYRLASGFVYNVALRIARSHADAEEITQEVFVKMHAALPKFEFRSSCKTWLYRITANAAISRSRKSARESILTGQYRQQLEVEAQPSPSDDGIKEQIVAAMLGQLDEDQRACVVLRDMEGLAYEEIAAILRVPLNTVRSRLHRAREAMLAYVNREKQP